MSHGDGGKQFQAGSRGVGRSCRTALPGMVDSGVHAVKTFAGITQLHSLQSGLGDVLWRPAHNSAAGRTALTPALPEVCMKTSREVLAYPFMTKIAPSA